MANKDFPSILLDFKKNRIRIHSPTLRLLGPSNHFRLLVHPRENSLILQVCDGDDARSFHGPGRERPAEIYSCSFMRQLYVCGQWDRKGIYRFPGKVIPAEGAILFDLNSAVQAQSR